MGPVLGSIRGPKRSFGLKELSPPPPPLDAGVAIAGWFGANPLLLVELSHWAATEPRRRMVQYAAMRRLSMKLLLMRPLHTCSSFTPTCWDLYREQTLGVPTFAHVERVRILLTRRREWPDRWSRAASTGGTRR